MAKDNKSDAKKIMVKNAESMHPEEELIRHSQEPGTTSRTKTGMRPLPGAFGKSDDKKENEQINEEAS